METKQVFTSFTEELNNLLNAKQTLTYLAKEFPNLETSKQLSEIDELINLLIAPQLVFHRTYNNLQGVK
jgi:hypothetical protein